MPNTVNLPVRLDLQTARPIEFARMAADLHLFRDAIDRAQDGVIISDFNKKSHALTILHANPAAYALCGVASPKAMTPDRNIAVIPQEGPLWESLLESHQSTTPLAIELSLTDSKGEKATVQVRSHPLSQQGDSSAIRITNLRDITQTVELEDTLRRNERLACIGLLAAGIAHEINNPAGSALLAAETALAIMDSPQSSEQVAACLHNIVASVDRCGRIVRTLLRYTREEPTERQACSINDVAEQSLELARPYAERHRASLLLDLTPDVPLAPMNPLEIELVLVNFVRNAVEAGRDNTFITIRTDCTDKVVRVAVSDNGCGMNKDQLAHIFDPLYTTKRRIGGSGIGMSIAYGIIKGHEGTVQVASEPGVGTTVTIELPYILGT